ncbi:MAG: hypothetical protein HC836_26590 [Richelia sp. RM2_1_2]|nr:hypothetical protein [Richelia sp. RM1_1_1]NJO61684.1 hypothetical protein [Richelia sp. RM2_1_2]
MVVALEVQQSIQSSLKNLKNLDSLKKLFWSQLNYERENKKLSVRKLTDGVIGVVEGEPLLLASGGVTKDFHVIYTRLKSQDLSRQDERVVVNHLLKEHPYALFVFSNRARSRWHFLNVKYDTSPQKRRLFRRITVGEGEQLRTATERIALLDLENIKGEGWLPNYYVPTQYFIDWSKTAVKRLRTTSIADVKIGQGQSNKIKAGDSTKRVLLFVTLNTIFVKG